MVAGQVDSKIIHSKVSESEFASDIYKRMREGTSLFEVAWEAANKSLFFLIEGIN